MRTIFLDNVWDFSKKMSVEFLSNKYFPGTLTTVSTIQSWELWVWRLLLPSNRGSYRQRETSQVCKSSQAIFKCLFLWYFWFFCLFPFVFFVFASLFCLFVTLSEGSQVPKAALCVQNQECRPPHCVTLELKIYKDVLKRTYGMYKFRLKLTYSMYRFWLKRTYPSL